MRVEDYRPESRFGTVICRAFSDLHELCRQAQRLCTENGRVLAMKGVYPVAEIEGLDADAVVARLLGQVEVPR